MSTLTLRDLFVAEKESQKQANVFLKVTKKQELEDHDTEFLVECRTKLNENIEILLGTDVQDLSKENVDALKAALTEADIQRELLTQAISGEEIKKNLKKFKALGSYDFTQPIQVVFEAQVEEVLEEEILDAPVVEAPVVEEPTEEVD